MRLKTTLAAFATVAAAGVAVALSTPSATASLGCPPGSVGRTVKLPTGQSYNVCVPIGQQCDPGPCPSTAPPARD